VGPTARAAVVCGGPATLPEGVRAAKRNRPVTRPTHYVRPIGTRSLLEAARARNPLPPGTGAVGLALGIAGLTAYAFLVVTARALGPDEYAPLSVLWVLALVAGPGFFLPVEQEIARALAARRARDEGGGPVVRRAAVLALSLLGGLLVVGGLAGPLLADELFSDESVLVVAWLLTLVAACAAHLARGVLSGLGHFRGYARIIGGESAVRLAIALVLTTVGVETVGPYGLSVAAGPLVAVAWTLSRERDLLQPGPPAPWSEVTVALAWLLLGSALSMLLMNAGPILVELLATSADDEDAAGRFLAGLIVARVPLFLFQAVQAALLPRLSELAGAGRTDELRRHLGHLLALVAGIGVAGTLFALAAGPQVVRLLFGGDFDLGHRTMGLLGLGSSSFMVALLLAQATIAVGGHRRMALAWLAGVLALVAVAANGNDLFLRVELAAVAGGLTALVAQAVVLRRLLDRGAEISSGDLIEAAHDLSLEP
jgi:O-antigen/teichoic acid export membrane protein